MPYRIEDSPNSRAGCTNSECNKAKVKIQKGELRFATQITVQEHTSWKYRHWGCVTPEVIQNWKEENEGDPELIDGYDELSAESKEKVDYALKNGHVHDDDWKGDLECNRPGQKGFRLTKAQKEKLAKDDEDEDAPKSKGKRGRAKKEDDEDEEPAPKKSRAKGKKAAAEEDTPEEAEALKPKRGKKAVAKEEVDEDEDDVEEPEPPKAKRGRKAAPKKDVDEDDANEEPAPPKAKRGKKAAAADGEKAAPQGKRSGRKKAPVNYEEE